MHVLVNLHDHEKKYLVIKTKLHKYPVHTYIMLQFQVTQFQMQHYMMHMHGGAGAKHLPNITETWVQSLGVVLTAWPDDPMN